MKKVIFGILLLAAAVFIILSACGVEISVISGLSLAELVLTALLLALTVCITIDRAWEVIPYPLMIVFFFLEDNIGNWLGKPENFVNNWLIFLCAVIASIGISLIAAPIRKKRRKKNRLKHKVYVSSSAGQSNDNGVKMGSETKYIDCTTFEHYYYKVKMGEGILYFENIESYTGGGSLNVDCKMGNMKIFVPNGWHIKTDINNRIGNVSLPNFIFRDGPELMISGECMLGEIEIDYV